MEQTDPTEILRTTTLFAGLRSEELEAVRQVGVRREFSTGDQIIESGATGARSLWLILDGEVEVLVEGEPINVLVAGEYFGRAPTTTLEFRRSHLLGLVSTTPEIAIGMLDELSRRLRAANDVIGRVIVAYPEAAEVIRELARSPGGDAEQDQGDQA